MQKLTKDALIEKAVALLESGAVSKVLGWKEGEFAYDVTPYVFKNAEELKKDFVFNTFCGANLSKYLIKECAKDEGKVLVFLKPCDTYSFNQLLTEHRFDREKVYAVGISCDGMADISKIREKVEGISDIKETEDGLTVTSLYDGDIALSKENAYLERCISCKSKKHVAYDELMGEEGEVMDSDRFMDVERLENMTPEERYAFWQGELSRCIRCNACRDACPACTCEQCVFTNAKSGFENKAAADSFEEKMFHIIRAFHVAGRCTDCGECSRVCPQNIPLHLINRKYIKDINTFYGEYQAGEEAGQRSPLVNYTLDDIEPCDAVKKGDGEDA